MFFVFGRKRSFTLTAQPMYFAALALGVASVATSGVAHAQSSTLGAINGTVSDASGALLPGASVTVTSVDTGVSRVVKSNKSGEYDVDALNPGVYTVDFEDDGFKGYIEKSVTVTVGSTTTLSPKLSTGAVTDKVEVTDQAPILHTEDNAISTTIDNANIQNLPINGRRWSDFARLTPGVVSNPQGFGLLSFRGISYLLNNNTIDGADDNQAYYSEARGRTRMAFTIPPSAVQEFQVNTSNYSAQYGRAAGGVINTITKSGGNSFHGELFFFDRDNDFGGATNPYTLLSVSDGNGGYNQVPTKPTDWRKDWGGTIGGPLWRDKLFFIYTYDQERRNFPGISRPTDPNDFFAPSNATLPSNETCSTSQFTTTALTLRAEGDYDSCLIAALYGVPFQAGSAYYQQGLGILQSFFGTVARRQDQVINLPKLDWQINDRNRLSLMYNRMRYSSPHGLYSQASVNQAGSGWGNDNVKEDFGIAHLTSVISNSFLNDALVQYGRDFEFDPQDKPLPNELPLANNQFHAAPGTQIGYFFSSGAYIGANPDLPRFADPDERRLQLLDGVTWTRGNHVFKAGLEYNKVSDFENNLYNGNGSYSYDWTYNFIADYLNATTGVGGPNYTQTYYTLTQSFGSAIDLITTREYAGYVTDDWRILPNLTLTLGVRYEYEYVPPSPSPNPAVSQTYNRPDDRNNVGPRVGFAWNVYGDGKTTLRGGYGMYYGRIVNSNILQTYLESGGPNGQESVGQIYGYLACAPKYPAIYTSLAAATSCGGAPTIAYFDAHMQNPQVHEADLALEQDMGHGISFGVTYMMSLGRELPSAVDTNYSTSGIGVGTFAVAPAINPAAVYSFAVSPNSEAVTSTAGFLIPPQTGGYNVLPHGGKPVPAFPTGFQQKFFLGFARKNPAYYQILDVQSSVNSSYNALAFQVNKRFEHGFSVLTNFTWSHALDGNPYESTVVPGATLSDPTNPRSDYGNSATDVRHRYVGALVYEPITHFRHGWERQTLAGWRIAPVVQIQNGLPYSPTISTSGLKSITLSDGTTASLAGTGYNGTGASRVPWLDRDAYTMPKTAVVDLRLGKNFYIPNIPHLPGARLEIFAELFNVMNHQNITAATSEAYTLTDNTTSGFKGTATTPVQTLSPYGQFGTYTNSNSNYTYSSRQLQIAGRLHF